MSYGDQGRAGTASLGSTSSSLLRRVRNGEADAWRRLAKLYAPAVFVWCHRSKLTAHDSADVVQETFLAVASHLSQFRRDQSGDSFRAWLWTIARNKIYDHFRRLKNVQQAIGGETNEQTLDRIPQHGPPDIRIREELSGLVERWTLDVIRAQFENRTWNAFWRTAVDGQPAAEVAAEYGMTTRAVRQAKYRVLRRLRQELGELLD